MLLAEQGVEETAIRDLRLDATEPAGSTGAGVHIYDISSDDVNARNWSPLPYEMRMMLQSQIARGTPRVGDLFDVNQGALSGNNDVFLISSAQLKTLRGSERRLFRPCAGTSTIRYGTIEPGLFVWYPYDENGIVFNSEEELIDAAPDYYASYLRPAQEKLAARPAATSAGHWWALTRERAWQRSKQPKLVSAFFGQRGSFAYDAGGAYVVTHGFSWHWRPTTPGGDHPHLPWAYLALLNSGAFETMLGFFCPRVQGGQYNLAKRFTEACFLPDLADDSAVTRELLVALSDYGRAIHSRTPVDFPSLDRLASRAYGIEGDRLPESRG